MPDFESSLSNWERRLMGRKQESISSVADLIKNGINLLENNFIYQEKKVKQ